MSNPGISRSKKIALISHCVLNQNAVICNWERASGAFAFVKELVDAGVGIIQLPCPEFQYGGCLRPSRTYEDYNTPDYRALCRQLATPVVSQISEYLRHGYIFCGVIGIENSPTCSITGQRGVLMEELFALFSQHGIQCPFSEVPEEYLDSRADIPVDLGLFYTKQEGFDHEE